MDANSFLAHIQRSDRNRALMARIALNRFLGPMDYPVDISELRFLSPFNRAMTTSFREWAFSEYTGLQKNVVAILKDYASGENSGRITS
jgi:ABC-type uncharacterized transport system YnjBCD ATPase subunit